MSNELEKTQPAGVPALAYNPSLEITAEDIPTPRVRFAQGLSGAVTDGNVPFGSIYSALGKEDPDPVVLAELAKSGVTEPPVRFYVLDLRKGYSYTDVSDDFRTSETYPDLSTVLNGDAKKVRRTADYTIAIPEFDDQLPYKFLVSGTSYQASKAINLILMKASANGENPATVPFTLQGQKDSNDKGTWVKALVRRAEVPAVEVQKDLTVVTRLAQFVTPPQAQVTETPAAPALD